MGVQRGLQGRVGSGVVRRSGVDTTWGGGAVCWGWWGKIRIESSGDGSKNRLWGWECRGGCRAEWGKGWSGAVVRKQHGGGGR